MGRPFLQISENKRVKYRLKSALKSDSSGHLNKNIKKGNKLERTHSILKGEIIAPIFLKNERLKVTQQKPLITVLSKKLSSHLFLA